MNCHISNKVYFSKKVSISQQGCDNIKQGVYKTYIAIVESVQKEGCSL